MRKIDSMLILVSLFVLRVIAFSGSYADALCLIGILAFLVLRQVIESRKLESQVLVRVEEQDKQVKALVDEMNKVKNSSEGLKAAINMSSKR